MDRGWMEDGAVMCTRRYHESLKQDLVVFCLATKRLGHMPDCEAYQDYLLLRDCCRCGSTLGLNTRGKQ